MKHRASVAKQTRSAEPSVLQTGHTGVPVSKLYYGPVSSLFRAPAAPPTAPDGVRGRVGRNLLGRPWPRCVAGSPPSGPRSIRWSAVLITSSCARSLPRCSPGRRACSARPAASSRRRSAARWWLIEDVERAARAAFRELLGELDALRLAAAERRGRLAELDVAEPHVLQRASLLATAGSARRAAAPGPRSARASRRSNGPVLDFQRLAVVPPALALLARDVDVGRKCISMAMTPSPWHVSHRRPSR